MQISCERLPAAKDDDFESRSRREYSSFSLLCCVT